MKISSSWRYFRFGLWLPRFRATFWKRRLIWECVVETLNRRGSLVIKTCLNSKSELHMHLRYWSTIGTDWWSSLETCIWREPAFDWLTLSLKVPHKYSVVPSWHGLFSPTSSQKNTIARPWGDHYFEKKPVGKSRQIHVSLSFTLNADIVKIYKLILCQYYVSMSMAVDLSSFGVFSQLIWKMLMLFTSN